MQKYNIEDIARLAGVSRGTVSRVLNNHTAVSDKTRQRVMKIIEEMNYLPNFSARHMRTKTSNQVGFGLITDEVITTPYAVAMISGAQESLWARGKVMLVINAGYGTAMTEASLDALLQRRVEGIIYATMFHRGVEIPARVGDVPIILANCFSVHRDYASAVPDEVGGGYAAIHFLLSKGHRRIGFINLGVPANGMAPIPAAIGRLEGYRQALAEYDIPYDPALVKYTNQTPKHNFELTLEFMSMDNPPTAIFCGNDRTAMGCYSALGSLQLRIPQDVAVVGFDNQEVLAEAMWPPLTTVQLPHYEMGQWAVEYLMTVPTVMDEPPIQQKIPCPLVIRDSA